MKSGILSKMTISRQDSMLRLSSETSLLSNSSLRTFRERMDDGLLKARSGSSCPTPPTTPATPFIPGRHDERRNGLLFLDNPDMPPVLDYIPSTGPLLADPDNHEDSKSFPSSRLRRHRGEWTASLSSLSCKLAVEQFRQWSEGLFQLTPPDDECNDSDEYDDAEVNVHAARSSGPQLKVRKSPTMTTALKKKDSVSYTSQRFAQPPDRSKRIFAAQGQLLVSAYYRGEDEVVVEGSQSRARGRLQTQNVAKGTTGGNACVIFESPKG